MSMAKQRELEKPKQKRDVGIAKSVREQEKCFGMKKRRPRSKMMMGKSRLKSYRDHLKLREI